LEQERVERDKQIQEHLRNRAETLRQVDRRKNEFLATLGHEMRNPLAPLGHAVRLLEFFETDNPVLVQVCDVIKRQVQQLSRLADDLLDAARIAQGKVELRKEPVALAAIVEQAVQTSMPHLKARHHHFESSLPSEPLFVDADPARLTQIIVNLLNNAAKYTEPGGRVTLSVQRHADQAVIGVRDTGIGIPPETLPHVFEMFTQGEWATDHSQGGMGIGLALVRRLVDLHGGTITAASGGIGQGSEFVVRLPALSRQFVRAAPASGDHSPPPDGPPPCRRILVVDDNVDAANSLRMLLSLDRHEVQVAHDGASALRIAEEFRPEVILLDLGLPRMAGYQVAQRLRQRPEMEKVLLVALTGYGQDDVRRRSQEAGFNAHFVKPLDLAALQSVLVHHERLVGGADDIMSSAPDHAARRLRAPSGAWPGKVGPITAPFRRMPQLRRALWNTTHFHEQRHSPQSGQKKASRSLWRQWAHFPKRDMGGSSCRLTFANSAPALLSLCMPAAAAAAGGRAYRARKFRSMSWPCSVRKLSG
jgi:CheY-like chemotaxis protein